MKTTVASDGGRVLFLDDPSSPHVSLLASLRRARRGVDLVFSASDALDVLQRRSVPLAFLGLNERGGEWLSNLSSLKRFRPGLPVILFGTNYLPEIAMEALELSAFSYVTAATPFPELQSLMIRALSASRGASRDGDSFSISRRNFAWLR